MGGLSRRAYILNKIRGEEEKPLLVLDAGALLFPDPSVAPPLFTARKIQAEGVLEAMSRMGYDAVGVAPHDLAAGAGFLSEQPSGSQLPWLSMNLIDSAGHKPLFAPYMIKQAGDLSIGIIGITGHQMTKPNQTALVDYEKEGWEHLLPATLDEIKDRTDMIILLSSLDLQTNRKIAERFHDIHLIIQAGQAASNQMTELTGNALITQVGSRGKHIGRLDIDWQPSHTWQQSAARPVKQLKDSLDRTNWQISRLERRLGPEAREDNNQYRKLSEERDRLIRELNQQEALQSAAKQQLSTYRNSSIGLSVSLPEEQQIREIVLRTKIAVNDSNKTALQDEPKQRLARQQAFSNMAGWQACRNCHQKPTEFWQKTGHARAWQTLEKVNQQFNPECIICHVTLPTYDQETVFNQDLLSGLNEEYKSVSCETCHGPAKAHSLQPGQFHPRQPDEQLCRTCHTPERDDNFVYQEKLAKIRCPAAGH